MRRCCSAAVNHAQYLRANNVQIIANRTWTDNLHCCAGTDLIFFKFRDLSHTVASAVLIFSAKRLRWVGILRKFHWRKTENHAPSNLLFQLHTIIHFHRYAGFDSPPVCSSHTGRITGCIAILGCDVHHRMQPRMLTPNVRSMSAAEIGDGVVTHFHFASIALCESWLLQTPPELVGSGQGAGSSVGFHFWRKFTDPPPRERILCDLPPPPTYLVSMTV